MYSDIEIKPILYKNNYHNKHLLMSTYNSSYLPNLILEIRMWACFFVTPSREKPLKRTSWNFVHMLLNDQFFKSQLRSRENADVGVTEAACNI